MLDMLDEIEIWIMECGSNALINFGANMGRRFVGRWRYYTKLSCPWKERGVVMEFVI
jgi:hypothetical protein